MKDIDFDAVESNSKGGGTSIPNGAYVARITDVIDDDRHYPRWGGDPYAAIIIRYEIDEGDYKDFFTNNNKPDFTHEYEFRYDPEDCKDERDSWRPREFKAFWSEVLPSSNDGWKWNMTPNAFKGLKFGVRIRTYRYLTANGEESDLPEVASFITADFARSGKAKVPEDRIQRKLKEAREEEKKGSAAAINDSDLPF